MPIRKTARRKATATGRNSTTTSRKRKAGRPTKSATAKTQRSRIRLAKPASQASHA